MFDHTSRYANLPVHAHPGDDGQGVSYVGRRILPRGETLKVLVKVTTRDGERLDQITARVLGDPAVFWRIADANDAMQPADLTAVAGRELVVPVPQI